jgi:hypothetical protein
MLLWFPFAAAAIVLLVSGLLAVLSGWPVLAKRFRSHRRPAGRKLTRQVYSVGGVPESGVTNLVIAPEGLYLSVFPLFRFLRPPLLVPWREIRVLSEFSFFGLECTELDMATSTTVVVKRTAHDAMRSYVSLPPATPN